MRQGLYTEAEKPARDDLAWDLSWEMRPEAAKQPAGKSVVTISVSQNGRSLGMQSQQTKHRGQGLLLMFPPSISILRLSIFEYG